MGPGGEPVRIDGGSAGRASGTVVEVLNGCERERFVDLEKLIISQCSIDMVLGQVAKKVYYIPTNRLCKFADVLCEWIGSTTACAVVVFLPTDCANSPMNCASGLATVYTHHIRC